MFLFQSACAILVLCLLVAPAFPADENSTPADSDTRGLTFYMSFDRQSLTADYAVGDPNPLSFEGNLEFRGVLGPNVKPGFQIEKDETLEYHTDGNADVHQGTIVLWLMAQNYSPGQVKVSDQDLSHKPYATLKFSDGQRWVNLHLYQYYSDNRALLLWDSSWAPKNYRVVAASLEMIRSKQWFQLAASWDQEKIKIYFNGKFVSEALLPAGSAEQLAAFKPTPQLSLINLSGKYFDPYDPSKRTSIDEVRIYSRMLTDIEIEKLYRVVAPQTGNEEKLPDFDIQLDGVDDGGPLDRLRVTMNYESLNSTWQNAIKAGKVYARAICAIPGLMG